MNKTDIINHALTLLGQATVISAEGAPAMDALFNNSKKRLLRSYPFACARKDYVLNPLSEMPEFGYLHKYQLPADCLRVDPRFFDKNGGVRKGDAVYTDAEEMKFTGIADIDEAALTEDVATLLAYDLAIETCFLLTSDKNLEEQLKRRRADLFESAKRDSAQESTPEEIVYACSWGIR